MDQLLQAEPDWYLPSILAVRGPPSHVDRSSMLPSKPQKSAAQASVLNPLTRLDRDELAWKSAGARLIKIHKVLIPGQTHKLMQDRSMDHSDSESSSEQDPDGDFSGDYTPPEVQTDSDLD
jgi:hypothetical protein